MVATEIIENFILKFWLFNTQDEVGSNGVNWLYCRLCLRQVGSNVCVCLLEVHFNIPLSVFPGFGHTFYTQHSFGASFISFSSLFFVN